MHAAVVSAPGRVELESIHVPEPGDREVRVRIEGCGVCGSDLPVWSGRPWFEYPRPAGAPGHEAWGVVDALGPLVAGIQVGDRVAGRMYRAYAEFDLAEAGSLVRLPPELDGASFPGEPLGRAINVMRRSGVGPGDTVAIVGVGFLGALLTQLCAESGAEVIAISRRPIALDMASEAGAEHVLNLLGNVTGRVCGLTRGRLCDVVFETGGVQETLDLASQLVRIGGRLVIAGYHQDGPRRVDMQQWNLNAIDVINPHERDPAICRDGLALAIREVTTGRLDLAPLLTHTFRLDEVGRAFHMQQERPDTFMKALVLTS
jgi:threonine dehydrogenase-like Zn-dependent dehydrogenase